MKSYVEYSLRNGKKFLPVQYGGDMPESTLSGLVGSRLQAFGLPDKHSLTTAWYFALSFDTGCWLVFSSACTDIGGWDEVGSINLEIHGDHDMGGKGDIFVWQTVEEFKVNMLGALRHENDRFCSDCGIFFDNGMGESLIICAGIPPGSVSVASGFSLLDFEPEIPVEKCRKIYL